MFGVKDGFDIVIGNPPYVGISKLKDKKILEKHGYKTFENTGDIYSLFYEVGNKLLKNGGCLNFITSRQWINAGYGKSTRKYFAEETNPIQLIDFGKSKIFESATVFVNILIFQKGKNLNQLKACLCPEDFKISEIDLESYFNNNSVL
jgi:adenine-specific DNA-methyltransferase